MTHMAKIPPARTKYEWIGWLFFTDLLKGLGLTFSYLFARTVTEQYPDKEKWAPYPRYRGHHFLKTNEAGEHNCVACELCAKICPCDCIDVVPFEDENGARHPIKFEINLARCLFCGLCEDACPADAIALGQVYEFCAYDTDALIVGRDDLAKIPQKTEAGGWVTKARLAPQGGVSISVGTTDTTTEESAKRAYDWWSRIRKS